MIFALLAIFAICASSTATLNETSSVNDEKVIKKERGTICLPEDHVFLRMRIPFLEFMSQGHETLIQISDALGKFGSAQDQADVVNHRNCDNSQLENGLCKLTGVTALTDTAEIAAYNSIALRAIELSNRIGELKIHFRSGDIHSQKEEVLSLSWKKLEELVPWQGQVKDSGHLAQPSYNGNSKSFTLSLYPSFKPAIWTTLTTHLPKTNNVITFTRETLKNYFPTLTTILDRTDNLLDQYEQVMDQIKNNRFPIKMMNLYFDLAHIKVALTNMPPGFEADKMIPEILQMPFSVSKSVQGWCDDKANSKLPDDLQMCYLDVITIVPIIAPNKRYKVFSLSAIPQVDQTYVLKKLKWESIQIPAKLMIKGLYHSFFSNETDLDCYGTVSDANCNLCYANHVYEPEGNKCLEQISEGLPITSCPVEKIDNPTNSLTQLSEDLFSYIDNSPGNLEATCSDGTRTIPLGYSGTIQLTSSCKYKMIDGPVNSRVSLPPSISMEIIPKLKNPLKELPGNTLINDLSAIQLHFRTNAYIYLIAMGCALLVMATVLTFFCYLRCKLCRSKSRVSRKRQTRAMRAAQHEMETPLEEMLPPLRPAQAKWPSIKFLPSAISIRPTN